MADVILKNILRGQYFWPDSFSLQIVVAFSALNSCLNDKVFQERPNSLYKNPCMQIGKIINMFQQHLEKRDQFCPHLFHVFFLIPGPFELLHVSSTVLGLLLPYMRLYLMLHSSIHAFLFLKMLKNWFVFFSLPL